jgi:regulator of replication initiation timing
VDQKKEMFLVEMSYNTIKDEIQDLKMKTTRKTEALAESNTTLDKDNAKLVKFIEDDNKTTSDKVKESEKAEKARKDWEAKIKKLDD